MTFNPRETHHLYYGLVLIALWLDNLFGKET